MKKGTAFVAGLLLILSLIGFASALGCSTNQSQIIMKLSSSSNAHGALWNQSYGINICYNDIFKPAYSGAVNPHDGCTNHNNGLLLKLYSENNSHVAFDDVAYTIPVCYQGLKDCKIGACTSDNCGIVAYISGAGDTITNAHISSRNSPSPGYSPISCVCTNDCVINPIVVGPTGCYGYDNPTNCNEDTLGVATGTGCPLGKDCICNWSTTASECDTKWTATGIDSITGDPCDYSCTVSGSEATECSGGSQIIRTLATVSASATCLTPDCQSSSATVSCGEIEASLPFFGYWQIVSSLISITLVYALLERKRLL